MGADAMTIRGVASFALSLAIGFLLLPRASWARPEYAVQQKKNCNQCHVNVWGGGPRMVYGKVFGWRMDAGNTITYANAGSYTFSSDRARPTLQHEHARDPSDTYRLEFPSGTIVVFFDFDYATTGLRGKLSYIEDLYGNRLTLAYDGSQRIDYITDPSGHYVRYSYLSSGDNSGKLDYIRVFRSSSTADADLIAIVGPQQGFQEHEIAALEDYLKRGGSLWLALEVLAQRRARRSRQHRADGAAQGAGTALCVRRATR